MTDASELRAGSGVPGGLGGRLRRVRTARGLSVRELARRAGCSASLLSQVERGVTAPSAGVVYALANQLGISIDSLFSSDDVEPAELPHSPEVASPHRADPLWGRATGADG